MSTAAAILPVSQEYEISTTSNPVHLPPKEATLVSFNGVRLEAERISGTVVGSRIKQHDQIYTTHHNSYGYDGERHVHSTVQNKQWETSEVRLKLDGGREKLFQLPFAISVGEGDLLSVISVCNTKSGKAFTAAAQNHNIEQWFSLDRDGLQKMCAQLGVFKLTALLGNKPVLCVFAVVILSLYGIFGSLLWAAIGGFFLAALLLLGFQYLVLLPYVLAVWPNTNRQLRAFFEDFSPWP
ncbi:hypothetical protein [Rhizobium rhizophilum]|uniref:Uncharacterized protein n=1 Tax=Rhizobium rhizophilum TaxID=1850373 RepID=A0ABY2QSP1_9HYPH|nr:hypothetical protein [Rhizobium rhizophilum]THV12756.1 hypothetical protein E9677_18755 [Rhizobium rhizophilum]